MAMSPSSTVHGGQHDTKYVTFELLMHAAFLADDIWGVMLEPARTRNLCCVFIFAFIFFFAFFFVFSSSSSADGANGNESDESEFEEGSSVGHEERLKLRILLQLIKNMAKKKPRVVRCKNEEIDTYLLIYLVHAQFRTQYAWHSLCCTTNKTFLWFAVRTTT